MTGVRYAAMFITLLVCPSLFYTLSVPLSVMFITHPPEPQAEEVMFIRPSCFRPNFRNEKA